MPQAQLQTEWSGGFTRGTWRYIRGSFAAAGQDSWTQAPAQSEDLFESLLNILPPSQGNLQRRWGYTLLNSTVSVNPTLSGVVPVSLYYDVQNNARRIILPIGTQMTALNEDGSTYLSPIFTAQAAPVRGASSRGYEYFASGNQADLLKWNGQQGGGVTNWGIVPPAVATVKVPAPGISESGTGTAWSGPTQIVSTVNYASATVYSSAPNKNSQFLFVTFFGYSLPTAAVINGIQIDLNAIVTPSGTSITPTIYAALTRGG